MNTDILIVANDDYLYAFKEGFYGNDLKEAVNNKQVIAINESVAYNLPTQLKKGTEIFIRNKYNGTYIDISDDTMFKEISIAKSLAVSTVLEFMGATSIDIKESVKNEEQNNLSVGLEANCNNVGIDSSLSMDEFKLSDISSHLRIRTKNSNVKPLEQIENVIKEKGLYNEKSIMELFNALKANDGVQSKSEVKISLSFFEELKTTLDIVAGLNIPLTFNMKAVSNISKRQIKTKTLELVVLF